jgi:hypothetical protein
MKKALINMEDKIIHIILMLIQFMILELKSISIMITFLSINIVLNYLILKNREKILNLTKENKKALNQLVKIKHF